MPPHSSHLLQPLDVGCFGPLKTAFSRQNQDLIRNHIFHVTKADFLATFYTSFLTSVTESNIKSGFRGSGLYCCLCKRSSRLNITCLYKRSFRRIESLCLPLHSAVELTDTCFPSLYKYSLLPQIDNINYILMRTLAMFTT
jgi:hypothetical protein